MIFEKLVWRRDRMVLEGLVFRLQHFRSDDWELGEECFVFYKDKKLIDQYARLWNHGPPRPIGTMMELGIYDGGSAAFWFECLRPEKLIAIDISPRGDSSYFRRYVASRGLEGRLKTHWRVDQSDRERLRSIVGAECPPPLDLVIDDASHIYGPTKASFEALFPLLREGGLYIIEDWAWAHWQEFQGPDSIFANQTEPTKLLCELVEAVGTSEAMVASMTVMRGLVVIERGAESVEHPGAFVLDQCISRRRPSPGRLRRWVGTLVR